MTFKSKYYAKNRNKMLQYFKKYDATHREQRRVYLLANRAKRKIYNSEYRTKNQEKIKARERNYGLANKEARRKYNARYQKNNPEVMRVRSHKYRVRRKDGKIGNQSLIVLWEKRWRDKTKVNCYWCLKSFSPKECCTDHIVPISKRGSHSIDNLCIACLSCNNHKHASLPSDWNKRIAQPALL